jgi:hypothetical protein
VRISAVLPLEIETWGGDDVSRAAILRASPCR